MRGWIIRYRLELLMLEARTDDVEQRLVKVEEEASPIDKLLEQVGGNGTYHQLTFLVHGIHWWLIAALGAIWLP